MDSYWKTLIREESQKDYFKTLIAAVQADAKHFKIFPDHKLVYSAFNLCSYNSVKVCILGADPYINPGQAHGLAFSVLPGVPIPPSLMNIFKEIQSDIGLPIPSTGYLIPWAQQGVMLLNTILTVREGQSASHATYGWEKFSDKVISLLNNKLNPIVFMLWGAFAKYKSKLLSNKSHLILTASHPSPLSVYRGFFGCKHFSQANQFLINNNLTPIDWSL